MASWLTSLLSVVVLLARNRCWDSPVSGVCLVEWVWHLFVQPGVIVPYVATCVT